MSLKKLMKPSNINLKKDFLKRKRRDSNPAVKVKHEEVKLIDCGIVLSKIVYLKFSMGFSL